MRAAKFAALAAYERVHPVGHARCTERCHEAHRVLCDALSDINAAYQVALPRVK
jgi:UDP-N-acetylglucosamine 2-epimerase